MKIAKNSLYVMLFLFGIGIAISSQGCSGFSSNNRDDSNFTAAPPLPPLSKKQQANKALADINEKIDYRRSNIKGDKRYLKTKQDYVWHLKHVDPSPVWEEVPRGEPVSMWTVLTQDPVGPYQRKVTSKELIAREQVEIAALETSITREKRALAELERQKQELIKQSSGCFLPETMVKMEDGSLKSFANLQPGQRVQTYDIGYDKLVNKTVVEVYSVKADHLYTINNQLTTTGGERLLTQNGWKKIRNLKQGDFVHLGGSMVEIQSINYIRVNRTLYNMQVADTHNFYVVTNDGSSYLVHNSSGGSGGVGSSGK